MAFTVVGNGHPTDALRTDLQQHGDVARRGNPGPKETGSEDGSLLLAMVNHGSYT